MICLRVCYYVLVIAAATAGLVNTLQLRGHGRRIQAVERVRDRIRDRIVRSDEPDAQVQVLQLQVVDLQARMNDLEKLVDKEVALLYLETAKPKEVRP